MIRNKLALILILFVVIMCYPSDAFAYINPGSGSDFFQMVMSFFAGVMAFFKGIYNSILKLFGKGNDKDYE